MVSYNVAVVGATGAVGQKMCRVLEERDFPVENLRPLASKRSAGKKIAFKGSLYDIEVLTDDSFKDIDIALFSAGSSTSATYAPIAVASGATVIDNSSAFRMDPEVPLVVPEINRSAIESHKGIIANPNCSTIQMVLVLKPLDDAFKLKRVVVSTYQAVSGSGKEAVEELISQSKAALKSEEIISKVYPHQIAFNILPHIDVFDSDGNTKEEIKMVMETRKIMDLPDLAITATAVRVPVINSHSESINIEFDKEAPPEEAKKILHSAPGITIVDDPKKNIYPMAISASGSNQTYVGRIRKDESVENGLNLWVVSDNLLKGAALNAVQIGEYLIS